MARIQSRSQLLMYHLPFEPPASGGYTCLDVGEPGLAPRFSFEPLAGCQSESVETRAAAKRSMIN